MHEHNWNKLAKTRPGGAAGTGRTASKDTKDDIYSVLSFTIHGQGTLDELTRFLFEFYNAGYLHQIHYIDIKPSGNFERSGTGDHR